MVGQGRRPGAAPLRLPGGDRAGETGEHWTDAFLHRIRGEILLQRDPANTGPAEEAFLTAIAIAQQQKAKSFELRAGFPLAKLYQSTGRTADAHAVLAPALESFSPTPEFPGSRKHKPYSPCCHYEPIKGSGDFRFWPATDLR